MGDDIDRELEGAASAGDESQVIQLIGQGPTVDWRGGFGATALHWAAMHGHTPVVTLLLDAGWSLEARTDNGLTPLACAAGDGHLETVNSLLLQGADIDTQVVYKWTPLHYASYQGHIEVVKTLLHHGANQEIRNQEGKTAKDLSANKETRALFSGKKGLLQTFRSEVYCQTLFPKPQRPNPVQL